MATKKKKVVAKAKSAAKTDKVKDSLVKCEVKLEAGEWVSPDSCKIFYIDEDANFPDIVYEIKTDEPGPYEWSWVIKWTGTACPQADGKKRFKPNPGALLFSEKGDFTSDSKQWKADLNGQVLGGDLTVKVKAGGTTFIRKTFIRGKNPGKERVDAYIETSWKDKNDQVVIQKIFQQESRYRQFYSDEAPLVSFDNGYGIGQLTREKPRPSYKQAWSWKEHVKEIMNVVLPDKRNRAKEYLGQKGKTPNSYTQEQYDTETMAYYNGAGRFYKWDSSASKWNENYAAICDPNSNRSWSKADNPEMTLKELLKKNVKPSYTGHCYAKHIREAQN
ncbi:MAG: hypothetical protein IV085_07950 [Thiobacillus sp.]|nr:hypothetical protein [Thiobacillus sp.]